MRLVRHGLAEEAERRASGAQRSGGGLGFLLLLLLPLSLTGCTFTPGTGFTTLSGASVGADFRPGARGDATDGVFTNLGYTVTVDAFELSLGDAELLELQGGAGGLFDPADPPEGYSLCHNGHCHADDGRLVSYAEIEAELAGGSATFVPIVTLLSGQDFELLSGTAIATEVLPSVELPLSHMSQLELDVGHMLLEGTVSGGPEGGGLDQPIALVVDLDPVAPFAAGIDFVVDRDTEPSLELAVQLSIDGTLFDDIDFATVSLGDDLILTEQTELAAAALVENLLGNLPDLLLTSND
jgi:hypothetical protein